MRKIISLILVFVLAFSLFSCFPQNEPNPPVNDDEKVEDGGNENKNPDSGSTDSGNTDSGNTDSGNTDSGSTDSGNSDSNVTAGINVSKIAGLPDDFMLGADISSLLSLEASGRVFYGFDGKEQDLLKTLSEAGINYIRVRVWNDPFDENGNGYGGGNCTVDTAIELGKRAAEYGMGLLVDFHYSDFWADPAKQKAPKAWANMTLAEKTEAIYDYTVESITKIKSSGVKIGMVQVGNETTGGFCGETNKANMYQLMKSAAKAVRDTDSGILIAVHYTNPEKGRYSGYANDLKSYGVDYDVFATSYYPEYHGTIENLKNQLTYVHNISGKKVMIAETSWAYSSSTASAYERSVQGQADEIYAAIKAMADLGDMAIGVFYWEPAWIDVPGNSYEEKSAKWEAYGSGWASSFAGSYDPEDAGKYYGGTACVPTALFDPDGKPLESLKTFLYVREGTSSDDETDGQQNYVGNPSFETDDYSMWSVTEATAGTVDFQNKAADAKDGNMTLHFWSDSAVDFTVEQTVSSLPGGKYTFSLYVQGDGEGDNPTLLIYVISDGKRYEQTFTLDGWVNWQNPVIEGIECTGGSMVIGIRVNAAAGAWGTFDCVSLTKEK